MKITLESTSRASEPVAIRCKDAGVLRKANGHPPNQDHFKLRWVNSTGQTGEIRRNGFELIHCKKVGVQCPRIDADVSGIEF
jgi:hypothetical protein